MARAATRKKQVQAAKPKVDPLVAAAAPVAEKTEIEVEQARRTGKRAEAEAATVAKQPLPDAIVAPTPDPAAEEPAAEEPVAEEPDETIVEAVFDEPAAEAPEKPRMTLNTAIDIACAALGRGFALKPGDTDRTRMTEDCPEAEAHNRLMEHRNAHDHEIG